MNMDGPGFNFATTLGSGKPCGMPALFRELMSTEPCYSAHAFLFEGGPDAGLTGFTRIDLLEDGSTARSAVGPWGGSVVNDCRD